MEDTDARTVSRSSGDRTARMGRDPLAPGKYQESAVLAQEMQDYEVVTRYLTIGEPSRALEQIGMHYTSDPSQSTSAIDWQIPTIQALAQLKDGPALLEIFEKSPSKFENHEDAALLVASEFIARGELAPYSELRRKWQGRTSKEAAWFDLDVDALLIEGRREEALQALSTSSFEGSADVGRLSRLAVLRAPENLKVAWNYLTEARAKDPNNGNLLSARAEILNLTIDPSLRAGNM